MTSSNPESELAQLKAQARQAEAEYQRSLARIEAKKGEVREAALALKDLGVSSLSEAEELVTALEAEVEESLARVREVLA